MRKAFLLLLVAVAAACSKAIPEEDLAKINGYWEIEKAILPDGAEKEYSINETIDYFELKGTEGFRKKVMPQLDGTYRTADTSEEIAVKQEDGMTYIHYTTKYAKWKEQLIELTDDELILRNNHDMEYHYKRPAKFSLK